MVDSVSKLSIARIHKEIIANYYTWESLGAWCWLSFKAIKDGLPYDHRTVSSGITFIFIFEFQQRYIKHNTWLSNIILCIILMVVIWAVPNTVLLGFVKRFSNIWGLFYMTLKDWRSVSKWLSQSKQLDFISMKYVLKIMRVYTDISIV